MKNLMTQKIVFSMLMTLVLAFSVQDIAGAVTLTKGDGDLQTITVEGGTFTITFTTVLTANDRNPTYANYIVDPADNNYYFLDSNSDQNHDSGEPRVTAAAVFYHNEETVLIDISGVTLMGTYSDAGTSDVTLTETVTARDGSKYPLTEGTVTVTGYANSAGEKTIRIIDRTPSSDRDGDALAPTLTYTIYVVRRTSDVPSTASISLAGITNGYDTGYYNNRGPQLVYNGDGSHYPVNYTITGGTIYAQKTPSRETTAGASLDTSTAAKVYFNKTNDVTTVVTAQVGQNQIVGVYIHGYPTLTMADANAATSPVNAGREVTFTAQVRDQQDNAIVRVPVKFDVKDKSTTGGTLLIPTNAVVVDSNNRIIDNPQGGNTIYIRTGNDGNAVVTYQIGYSGSEQVVTARAVGEKTEAKAYASGQSDRKLTVNTLQKKSGTDEYILVALLEENGEPVENVEVKFTTVKGSVTFTPRNSSETDTDNDPQKTIDLTDSLGRAGVTYDPGQNTGNLEVVAIAPETGTDVDDADVEKIQANFNVSGGSVTPQQPTQPSTGTSGITLNLDPIRGAPDDTVTLQATVRDTSGNVDTNATVNFTISDSSGRVSPSSARTNANGVAQTTVRIPDDDATLTATVSGYTGSRYTDQVNVIVDAAATDLEVVSGSGQTGAPGSTLSSPFVVRFEDSDGDPVSGARVTFAVETGGGSVSSSTDTTDSDGEAETTLTLGSAGGRNTVRASVSGTDYPGVSSVTITADAARPAEAVTIAGGDDQIGQVGRLLDEDLSVQVVDSEDNGISGVLVRFRITEGRGRLSRNSDRTDTDGYAEIGFTPTADGETVVEAYATGLSSAFFTINTGEPPAAIVLVSGNNQSGKPGAKLANPFVVEVVDENDDPVSGVSVTFAVTAGGGTLSTTSATTGSNGRAQTRLTLGEELGANTVQARVAGLTDRVTFNAKSGAEVLVDVTQRAPMYWISRKEGKLHRLVGEQIENLVPNVTGITSIAVDTTNNLLYFGVKTNDNRGAIRRANLNGSNAKVVRSLSSAPVDIAVGSQGKQVYWLTQGGGIRSIATAGGGQVRDVATNLPNPTEIVLSPNGFVYWAEPLGRIRRVRLTGTQAQRTPQTIVTGLGEPRGLSVSGGKIYWIDFNGSGGDSLRRANLDGTDRQKLKRFTVSKNVPRDMAVRSATKQIYWTRPNGKLQVSNLWGNFAKDIVTGLENPGAIVLGPGVAEVPIDQSTQPTQPTTPTTYSVYDVNKDGAVNNADLKIVSRVITGAATHARADVDGSGTVDITDLILVIGELEDDVAAPAIDVDVKALDIDFDRVQEQVETLLASGDRSIAAQRALLYLQHLLASARPDETVLLANYPNPFNPETWIPYHLAESTDVAVRIYDAQGVLVRALTLGHQMAGYYTSRSRAAYWDGRNALGERVASGVYFYQLETDEISPMRKMVILK